MKKRVIWSVVSLVVIGIVATAVYISTQPKEYDIRKEEAKKGVIKISVTATGFLQPILKVDIGTQVSGIVEKLYADFNSEVTKGQLLAELDKSTLQERVMQTEAALSDAKSNLEFAKSNYERVKTLFDDKAAPLTSFEDASNKLTQAKNGVVNASANHNQALVNLSYAKIYSPISGRILNRAVDEGQTVAASFNTPTLFTIANDLTKMQVEANVDEADIGQVKVGQSVAFSVDAYPGEMFNGEVSQVRLNPKVTTNVVTYTVIISAPNPDEKLFPGMTASVNITTSSPEGVYVSAEAIYCTPDIAAFGDRYKAPAVASMKQILWVETSTGIEQREVTTGVSDGVNILILNGISEGEKVILSAKERVKATTRTGGLG